MAAFAILSKSNWLKHLA